VELPDLRFEMVVDSGRARGSLTNVMALHDGTADLTTGLSDVAYAAYTGRLGDGKRFDQLRGVAVLELTPLHIVVRGDAPIHGVEDLRGRSINAGSRAGGTPITAERVLGAMGLSRTDVSLEWLMFTPAAERLIAGSLDAMFVTQGYPAESVLAATRAGARLLGLTEREIQRLRIDYPFLRAALIPAGTYPGQRHAVRTLGIDTLLMCRAGMDDAVVYALTKGLFAALPRLSTRVEALRDLDLDRAAAVPIPLHPGAAQYYREREIAR